MLDCTMLDYKSQVEKLLQKTAIKKNYNNKVLEFLRTESTVNENPRIAKSIQHIQDCATFLGFTERDGRALIAKANFCRERICHVCAWRRQSKFVAQTIPLLDVMMKRGYTFVFVTLTVKNCSYSNLSAEIDNLLLAYSKLLKRRKISRSWLGVMRGVELTYNQASCTFHPHIHLLVAVSPEYFVDSALYVSQKELRALWGECLGVDYIPSVDIRSIGEIGRGAVEVMKYCLKPSFEVDALRSLYYILHGRRLISFSGVFSKMRKELSLSDFENNLTDDVVPSGNAHYMLYKFDDTGGIYKFYEEFYIERGV